MARQFAGRCGAIKRVDGTSEALEAIFALADTDPGFAAHVGSFRGTRGHFVGQCQRRCVVALGERGDYKSARCLFITGTPGARALKPQGGARGIFAI